MERQLKLEAPVVPKTGAGPSTRASTRINGTKLPQGLMLSLGFDISFK